MIVGCALNDVAAGDSRSRRGPRRQSAGVGPRGTPGQPSKEKSCAVNTVSTDLFRLHLLEVTRLVRVGDLRPIVDTVFDLDCIADTHRALTASGVHGKLVMCVSPLRSSRR